MSKPKIDLMAVLEETAAPKLPPVAAPAAKAAPKAKARTPAPTTQGRAGLANVSAYLDPQFQTNLRMAKAVHNIAAGEAIADALNDWFKKMNLPVVSGVAAFTREGRKSDA
ncbi:hypothetical protein M527_00290 [Sphingobium indicum IP26]|uniref:Uncharacterized protein n=1 Tax=Sphingobium quisquiliarum P25 TaxID=1329909 RepID=T0HG51_9SPHN|nr:hypothetical protein [Sphingobium quisquiliarum]EPR13993.1 hypothetical protein M527_00290 [Sphingobium indicum IP26]EQA98364.1 hypothetical protein L288_20530 [Sphingobium quisquiliarum P25]